MFHAIFLFVFLFVGINVFVQFNASADDGSSGCGLGWQVTKSMTTSGSATRALTNATSSNSFAMTSGTSGCAKHDIVKTEQMDIHYTQANYEFLVAEAAAGEGEYLSGWALALGCSDGYHVIFKSEAQKNFEKVFTVGTNYSNALQAMKSVIENNSKLAGQCGHRS